MQNRLVGKRGATYFLIVIKDVSMNILNSQEVHMYIVQYFVYLYFAENLRASPIFLK
jgi:hypothetical protein